MYLPHQRFVILSGVKRSRRIFALSVMLSRFLVRRSFDFPSLTLRFAQDDRDGGIGSAGKAFPSRGRWLPEGQTEGEKKVVNPSVNFAVACCGSRNFLFAIRSRNFDHCHSLSSLYLPLAALASLPLYTREPWALPRQRVEHSACPNGRIISAPTMLF